MNDSLIETAVHAGVAEIALNRAEARNALSIGLIEQLDEFVGALERDESVTAILLYGKGKHFAAGADVKEMVGMTAAAARSSGYVGCSRALGQSALPVVCAVEGYALGGGCELVEMSDIVVASEDAVFGHPEITLAVMSGAGGIQRLVRATGKAVAMDVLLASRNLTAAEALSAGLISRVCPPGRAVETAREVARRIATMSRPDVLRIKQAARAAYDLPLDRGLELEKKLFHDSLDSQDRMEGMQAFLARRKPVFTGR